MTRAPSSAHRFAAARPMPLLAPVIQTVLLCQLITRPQMSMLAYLAFSSMNARRGGTVAHRHGEHVVAGRGIFNGDLT